MSAFLLWTGQTAPIFKRVIASDSSNKGTNEIFTVTFTEAWQFKFGMARCDSFTTRANLLQLL